MRKARKELRRRNQTRQESALLCMVHCNRCCDCFISHTLSRTNTVEHGLAHSLTHALFTCMLVGTINNLRRLQQVPSCALRPGGCSHALLYLRSRLLRAKTLPPAQMYFLQWIAHRSPSLAVTTTPWANRKIYRAWAESTSAWESKRRMCLYVDFSVFCCSSLGARRRWTTMLNGQTMCSCRGLLWSGSVRTL